MIHTSGLAKTFGPRTALAGVDLAVEAGTSVALVGPNGAGKTTLLCILATLVRPTRGTVRVAGLDVAKEGEKVRRSIGFLSHSTLLYEDLTPEQNLRFYARMYGLEDGPARIQELLEQADLVSRRHDLVRTFSRGMKQRLAVARAVLHRPQVLLLDEPYAGLDTNAARTLTGLLGHMAAEGCTVLLTTHNLEQGLAVSERVIVLSRGRLVYDERRESIDVATFADTYAALS